MNLSWTYFDDTLNKMTNVRWRKFWNEQTNGSRVDGMFRDVRPYWLASRRQLVWFLCDLPQSLYEEIQMYDGRVAAMLESGETLIGKCSPSTSASLLRSLENLSTRWENVKTRADERKTKLEEALKQADSFHESLNSSIVWLTNTEKTLNNVKPVSRVVDSCLAQIEQHKVGLTKALIHNHCLLFKLP